MKTPPLTPLVESLPATVPFVGPEAAERASGSNFITRLGANESLFGVSPKALKAMQQAASGAWMYPDPESFDLRHALAAYLGIKANEVVVGEGVDTLLGYLVRLYVEPGVSVVTSDGAYPTFNYHVAGYGGTLTKVTYRDDKEDPEGLLQAAHDTGARLIYLANPDNPMGTYHTADVILDMVNRLPENCLLVLDEAYIECAPDHAAPPIDTSLSNVIRLRTFSKAYGMAGARVGYAFGHTALIEPFEKVRNHFGMNRISQIGAVAALKDAKHLKQTQIDIAQARDTISQIARDNGLHPIPSATNFVTVDCMSDASFAVAVLEELVARGIFVRKPFAAPGDRCIRISCGRPEDLAPLRSALPEALAAARTRK